MKRALLIGVTDEHPEQRFQPGPSLAAIEALLLMLGGWSITRVEGSTATRDGILTALAKLAAAIGPEDTCLFYFVGHGGVVEIHDLPPPLGARPVFYVTAARSRQWSFEAVVDIEISLWLARIDRICGNVSAILDCCYSARTVRGPAWSLRESPAWLCALARETDEDHDELLAPTGHPRIVRLAASSALRMTFPDVLPEGHLGRLTRLFDEVVREAGADVDHLTWDAVAHRVRERAIWRLGCEEQWVTLAGPRQRLVFSREAVALPRTVGFVPHEGRPGGWIRAGELQRVQVDDEWGLADLTLDAEFRLRCQTRMRVVATDLNRALLEPIDGPGSAPPGASAVLLRARERVRVFVEGPQAMRDAMDRSAWIRASVDDGDVVAMLAVEGDAITVRSADDLHMPDSFSTHESGLIAAIERLEDWARVRSLLAVVRSRASAPRDRITVHLGTYPATNGQGRSRKPSSEDAVARLHAGDRMVVRIDSRGDWFVTAIGIDVAGRPALLDASEPDGHELLAGETWIVGEHPHRQVQGIELMWPDGLATDQVRGATLVVLASRRPIQLGHLVRTAPRLSDTPRVRRASSRGHLPGPRPRTGPELARDWTAAIIPYEFDPRTRTESAHG